jgi:hypothetical protein
MFADVRIDHFAHMRLKSLVRAFFIRAHHARKPHHIGGEDRGKTARGDRRGHRSAALPPAPTLT